MRLTAIAITLYAAMGIFTFGHSASNSTDSRLNTGYITLGAFFGGAAWPLYWAWELQE